MPEPLPPPLPNTHCVHCRKAIDTEDAYCRHCGKGQGRGDAWYYSPLWIATLAFVVIGPFALILLWKSTRMGPGTKYILAALILAYTVVIAYYFYSMIAIILGDLAEFDEIMKRI